MTAPNKALFYFAQNFKWTYKLFKYSHIYISQKTNHVVYSVHRGKGGFAVLVTPLAAKLVPIALAGMIALTPINTLKTSEVLEAAKQKIVTVIKKEGYVTTIDNGQQVKLPYEEKIIVERPNAYGKNNEQGIISKTIDICKKIYWWVKR